jgi:hypothetical protein
MSVEIGTRRNARIVGDDPVHAAERIRRASACAEMADVLRNVGQGTSVPDIKWMADVAVEELTSRARELHDRGVRN